MRFAALDLRSYGPFENAPVLDLSGGQRGLHLIIGPNEAGKSTALRAIRALLFDFPHSTGDSHGRNLASLRVGGTIRDEAGHELTFLRRKSGKKLWTPDDRTSLDPDALVPFLGRLDAATFETLFSTDHGELIKGGHSILAGKGRLGEMLFAAGTGLAQLDRVQKALQAEMDELFKGGNASNPTINKTLRELKTARDDVKTQALSTRDWVAADLEQGRAVTAAAMVARRRREAQAELDRWRSWLGALRIIPRRREVLDRLEARSETVVLADGFAEAYRADLEASRAADRVVRDARDAIRDVLAQLEQLGPPDPILLEANAVHRLHTDLGRYASARRDRPGLAVRLGRAADQVQTIEADLPAGLARSGGSLASLRDQVERLGRDQTELATLRKEAEAELARLVPTAPDLPSASAVGPEVLLWRSSLEEVIDRANAFGDLEAQQSKAAGKLATADEQATIALRGLALWAGTLTDLEALAIPPDASFDRAGDEIRAADDRARAAETERVRLEGDRLDLVREAERAEVGGPIPTEADLATRRTQRDARWRTIRRAWVDREPLAPNPTRLADDFAADLDHADALADALRREADRVTAAAQRAIDRRDLDDRLGLAIETRDLACADRDAATERWVDLWRPLGIEPLPPREMKEWVKERKTRLKDAKTVRDARAEVVRIAGQIDQLRAELGKALERVGEPGLAIGESLPALLARGRIVNARIDARLGRDAARGKLDAIQVQEVAWLDRWRDAVAPLGLPPETTLTAALAVLNQFAEWIEADRQVRSIRESLTELAVIERRFATEALGLAGRLAPELVPDSRDDEADCEPVAAALADRLARASEAKARRDDGQARLLQEQARLAQGESAFARAGEALAALAGQARCESVAEVPAAIRASAEIEADRATLKGLDERLDDHAGTLTRAGLLEALAGWEQHDLDNRIADAQAALDELDAEASQLNQQVGEARQRLRVMDDSPGAHEAGQVVENHRAHLEAEVERYVRLRLASAVLRESIERHRQKHQGPVLDRAGALFKRLTAGSFVGLQTDIDEKGEPILRGVRGSGAAPSDEAGDSPGTGPLLDVTAMSAGTADQLYLALRLASLSVHLDDHEPAPLVADDILVNFDDTRARAALEVLADLSARTQVLFFTHHDHLAEIARSCLDPKILFVHRLTTVGPIGDGTSEAVGLARPASRSKRPRLAPITTTDS